MNERTLYFSEFVRFFLKKQKLLLKIGGLCFLGVFVLILLFSKSTFLATATFRETKNKNIQGDTVQSFLKQFSTWNEELKAISVMRSKTLLSKVIAKLDLDTDPFHLQKALKIKKNRQDANLLHLSVRAKKRDEAIGILNAIMEEYQNYLRDQHEKLSKEQELYLKKRLHELEGEFKQSLDAFADAQEDFLGTKKETPILVKSKEKYLSEKKEIDFAIKRLENKPSAVPVDFGEIDLQTAQLLLQKNSEALDSIHSQMKKLKNPSFEMDPLGDRQIEKLLEKGTEIQFQLAQRKDYSPKEIERLKDELGVQKNLLEECITKKLILLGKEKAQIEAKLAQLRQITLDHLHKEKELIEEKLFEVQTKIADIAKRWQLEKRLKFKKELTLQILEGLTHFSESQGIHHHLFHIDSGPLDPADAPQKSESRHLFLYSTMGGLLGMFFSFVFLVLKGLPVSKEFLRDHNLHVAKNRLDALRQIAARTKKGEKLALIGSNWDEELLQGLDVLKSPSPNALESIQALAECDQFLLELRDEKPEDLVPFLGKRGICVLSE